MNRLARICLILLTVSSLGVWNVTGQDAVVDKPLVEDADAKLRLAGSQYEIIIVLLDQGLFETVPAEFEKILALKLSGPDEPLVADAAFKVADRLREARHYASAHEVVDHTLELVEHPESQFKLLMMRAKIYKDQRLFKQAIETYREAQNLENPE